MRSPNWISGSHTGFRVPGERQASAARRRLRTSWSWPSVQDFGPWGQGLGARVSLAFDWALEHTFSLSRVEPESTEKTQNGRVVRLSTPVKGFGLRVLAMGLGCIARAPKMLTAPACTATPLGVAGTPEQGWPVVRHAQPMASVSVQEPCADACLKHLFASLCEETRSAVPIGFGPTLDERASHAELYFWLADTTHR